MGILRVSDVGDSIVAITFETDDNSPFVLGELSMAALLDTLDDLGDDKSVSGVLFRSARDDVFCAGADVEVLVHRAVRV